MGIFTNFLLQGFSQEEERFYSIGTLYEVLSRLSDKDSGDIKRNKVKTLLSTWFTPTIAFREQGKEVPVYALEMHAVNENSNDRNGYGTYVFVPDDRKKFVTLPLTSTFAEPQELYDDEDPIKILSALYADADGYSSLPKLSVKELTLKEPDFFPLDTWGRSLAVDPLEEIFGLFDSLEPGEFAGLSLILVPPEDDWQNNGKMRIRQIEDPDYEESISGIEMLKRLLQGQPLPDQEADRIAGYKKRALDMFEQEQVDAIKTKINSEAFRCTLRVYASSEEIADDLAGIIKQRTSGKFNSLVISDDRSKLIDLAIRKEGKKPFLLSADEIASIWHVPDDATMGAKCHRPMPAATRPPDDLVTVETGGPGDIRYLLFKISGENEN